MGIRLRREHNPGPGLLLSLGVALAYWGQLSCASTHPPEPGESAAEKASLTQLLEGDTGGPGLSVRLAFGAAGDLDLYVSDPFQETVYYANTPSVSGGALELDRRCIHEAPRIETVRFPSPAAGRYRVGVDYPHPCDRTGSPVPFVVRVEVNGRSFVHEGTIAPLRFQPIVLEFDVPAAPGP
jgi:hypothetical protein